MLKNKQTKNHPQSKRYPAILAMIALLLSVFPSIPNAYAGQFDNRELEVTRESLETYEIGDEGPGGGHIFYIDGDTHYEAAPVDWDNSEDPGIQWGCRGQSVPGASGTAIGDGASNTETIVDFHDDDSNFNNEDYYTYSGDYEDIGCDSGNNGEVAAKTVSELNLNGVDDWFLPSEDELNEMYENLHLEGLGGFASTAYWSSSESSATNARYQYFSSGDQITSNKTTTNRVRPVRAFTHSTIHQFSFDIATSASVGAFRFQYCTEDPFPSEPCTSPSGMDASNFEIASQTGASGFSKDSTNTTTNEIVVTNSSLQSFSSSDPVTFEFSDVINPSEPNEEYFVRLYSYDGDDITTNNVVDDGGLAFSTSDIIDITARVQETLQFCVYTNNSCVEGGTQADLGILNTTTTETAQSYFDISTNARSGVIVTVIGDTLTSGSEEVEAIGDTPAQSDPGTEQFGLRVSNVDTGSQPPNTASPFDTMNNDEYLLDPNQTTTLTTSSGPIDTTTYEIEYAANVDNLTPTGVYDTQMEYVATAMF